MSWEYCYNQPNKEKKDTKLVTVSYCSSKCVSCAQARDALFARKEVSNTEPVYKKLPSLAQVMIKSKL